MSDRLKPTTPNIAAPKSMSEWGAVLVLSSALLWSFGGLLAGLADVANPWVTVFWRTITASALLLCFMLWRDGIKGTAELFREMGLPGLSVGVCFASASTIFIVALQFTTVANILLMQAGVPLIAAAISRVFFAEPIRFTTWVAIAMVITGIAIMVSDSLTGKVSPIGDTLAILIAIAFAIATVITRRYSNIRMTPAIFTGATLGLVASSFMIFISGSTIVELLLPIDKLFILFLFGLTLAAGMIMFTTGARTIPFAMTALIGTVETVAGPAWVWIFLSEKPSLPTIIGGGIVLSTIIVYLLLQLMEKNRARRIPPTIN